VAPHFHFKKDLNFYLDSSRAATKVGISASRQQAAGNSNLENENYIQNNLLRNGLFTSQKE